MTHYPLLRLLSASVVTLLLVVGVGGCASERRGTLGHAYDNVVARDNAYFLAREKMRLTEEKLYAARLNDYNRVLPLFPAMDEAGAKALAKDMEDIVKKASLPIQHRAASDWTDDAYVLIGKSRYYTMEYEDAARTFKYVNSTSKDANARHEALIWLMRTFIANKELDNAKAVSDVLDKETGLERNARELFLTRADYYLKIGESEKALENLEKAVPLVTPKNERSRTRYILAQLYQQQGDNKKAYAELNKILKKNPPYELDFFTKLMLAQVSDLNQGDRARLDKYFARLLKDVKNKEYRDKIYYEMARLDYRQEHYDQALGLLRQSARANTTNQPQKAYTFLLAGRIYYENLQKYRLAAAYYDSTVQSLPKEAPEYAATSERADILKNFAQQITTIETQDSLLTLARMDSAALRQQLTVYADAELEAKRKAAEALAAKQELERRRQTATGPNSSRDLQTGIDPADFIDGKTGAKWYFDNPTALSTARADFIKKWGDRPLQDNWRTVSVASSSPVTNQNGGVPVTVAGANQTNVTAGEKTALGRAVVEDPAAQRKALVAQYRQGLPLTSGQMAAAEKQVEEALFALGGIYNQQLREPTPAVQTYEKLLTRFPKGGHSPETYYTLYLLYKEQNELAKANVYAQHLRDEYAASPFTRLIDDPDYFRRTSLTNQQVAVRLDSAFALYKKQEFTKTAAALARIKKEYPESDLNDRVGYLNVLVAMRTQPPLEAKATLEKFAQEYASTEFGSRARSMLGTFRRYEAGEIAGALASTQKPVVSMFRPGEVNNRMRIEYAENEMPGGVARAVAPAPAPVAAQTAPAVAAPATTTAGQAPAAAPTTPATQPAPSNAPPATTAPAPTPAPPAATPEPPVSPYAANAAGVHAVVLVFPKTAAILADLPTQMATYNGRFYRANNLQVQAQPLDDQQVAVVVQGLPGAKVAQSYALKLRGPQSPLSKLRGAGYQTLVVGIDNLPILLQRHDVAEYQQFYQQNYR